MTLYDLHDAIRDICVWGGVMPVTLAHTLFRSLRCASLRSFVTLTLCLTVGLLAPHGEVAPLFGIVQADACQDAQSGIGAGLMAGDALAPCRSAPSGRGGNWSIDQAPKVTCMPL